ncbi:MAG: elongation factor G [Puniceicoccaceae bacterium]|nr:MAG: elongation factor G [Puniceicoccaceae bacterium]
MKVYHTPDIRNFAIVGHAGSGKTILAESMLFQAGVVNRLGSIEAGTTVSDYHVSEQEHKISVHASLLHLEWQDRKFNLIDTPGYLDFISEGLGALRVGDFALTCVHANHGIGVGTEQVWSYASDFHIPKILVVTAFDKEHTDFDGLLAALRDRFGKQVLPMTVPVNPGPGFNRVLDVMRNEFFDYEPGTRETPRESPASGEWKESVSELHRELIEYVAESDPKLMETFFEKEGLSEEEMRAGLHTAIQNETFIPLFCVSAQTNVGVSRLMDFIAKYGSSPLDRKRVPAFTPSGEETTVGLDQAQPVVYIFKTLSEAHVGDLSFFRVYSGVVKPGMDLLNATRNTNERLGQIFVLNGRNREAAPQLEAGDIGAAVKLRDTHTGNTLCDHKKPARLPEVIYPKPSIHGALQAAKGDEEKIANGLATLHEEDPTFLYRVDPEIRQTVISGQGELHMKVICERLKRRFNVEIQLVEPRVPFRETIRGRGEAKYRHKKQSGGAGQFAEVWMRVEPGPRGAGVDFKHSLVGQNVDRVFVPSVEKGVRTASEEGVIAGYRMTDLKVDFYDGKMHPVDSKDIAFQIAGLHAFKEACLAARPCLLEPIILVTVRVPEDCLGDVMGDISSRRGRILGMESEHGFQIIRAHIPQKELYHYSTTLRSLTGGRGLHSEELHQYEEMPRDLEEKVIAQAKQEREHAHA